MSFDRFKVDKPTAPMNTTWKADDGSIFFSDGTWIRVGDRLKAEVVVSKHAAEVDELRGKLDDVRMGIGCARGQRTTQYCSEAAQRDEVITKLLAMLKPGDEPVPPTDPSTLADWNLWSAHHSPWLTKANCYRFACEIAGRTE